MSTSVPVIHRRKPNSRKRWIEISIKMINGETMEVAKFTHIGDASSYVIGLQSATTVEAIYID